METTCAVFFFVEVGVRVTETLSRAVPSLLKKIIVRPFEK
jgi:hypothetical protein